MENNTIHTLSIINGDVKLDGFTIYWKKKSRASGNSAKQKITCI